MQNVDGDLFACVLEDRSHGRADEFGIMPVAVVETVADMDQTDRLRKNFCPLYHVPTSMQKK